MDVNGIENWPTRSEAGRVLRLSGQMIGVLMANGKLKFIATKAGRLIDPADLERLRAAREAKAAAE